MLSTSRYLICQAGGGRQEHVLRDLLPPAGGRAVGRYLIDP